MEIKRIVTYKDSYRELGPDEPIQAEDMMEWGFIATGIVAGSEYIGKTRRDLPKVDWNVRRVWRKIN